MNQWIQQVSNFTPRLKNPITSYAPKLKYIIQVECHSLHANTNKFESIKIGVVSLSCQYSVKW